MSTDAPSLATSPDAESPRRQSSASQLWMVGSVVALFGALACLGVMSFKYRQPGEVPISKPFVEPVSIVGPRRLSIAPDSMIWRNLEVTELKLETVETPLMRVTGFVLGRVRPGKESLADRWQFNSSELSNTYNDWLRSASEVSFAQSQLAKTKTLAEADESYLASVVKRLEPGVGTSIPESEFLHAKAQLLKSQLQGDKDIFAAQVTVQNALSRKAALERDLALAGVESTVFSQAVDHMVLVVASVPEVRVSQAKVGQACRVQFFAYPNQLFPAHVESLSSLISQDRRTLRVLFELNDEAGILRPGMFGDVGLGTEPRQSLLVPDAAMLHIGASHYLVAAADNGEWQAVPVELGETHVGKREITKGVGPGTKILTKGVILLKSIVINSLASEPVGAAP